VSLSYHQPPRDEWPSASELAEPDLPPRPRSAEERAALIAELAALQTITRCSRRDCRTTVDLDDDPAALQACGHVICDRCMTCDECEAAS
jgi:hypothetical protein